MSNILKIPESLQFYFENEQHVSAINQIIESDSLPIGLTWEEVEQYNVAKISALSTQLDYWRLMKELWSATWGKALASSEYKEVDPDFYDDEYSMEFVWDDSFYKAYEYKGNTIYFYCWSPENTDIQLGFCVESPDGQNDISNSLELSDGWTEAVDDDRRTQNGLIDIKGKTEIDIEPLIKLVEEVVLKLRTNI